MNNLLRLFFAIEISDKLRIELAKIIKQLRAETWGKRVHWTHPENLHITVRFIGACEVSHIPVLTQRIKEALKETAPFSLQFDTIHLFPSPSHPNVIAVAIQPSADLFKLARILDFSLVEIGFAAERRAFVPHLTLGRLSHHATPILPTVNLSFPPLKIDHIALLRSEEIEGKRIYTAIERLKLVPAVQPKVTVGAIVVKNNKVLLIKRKNAPNQGLWAIPGGKVEPGETLQQAAEREIKEETGLTIRAHEVIYVFDLIERDADDNLLFHYVIIDLMADYVSGELRAGDDATDACWVSKAELDQLSMTESTRKLLKEKIFTSR